MKYSDKFTGDQFVSILENLNVSKAEFAEQLDLDVSTVSRMTRTGWLPLVFELGIKAWCHNLTPEQSCSEWRERNNLTQPQAAGMLGLDRSSIVRYETGGTKPRKIVRYAMAEITRRLKY